MRTILRRGLKKIQRESRAIFQTIRQTIFPLWFVNPLFRRVFFQLYENSPFSRKAYFLSEYIQKPGTRWIRSEFDFEVRFLSKTIKIPVRSEFFEADMGLAFCLLGLDAEIKHLYFRIFSSTGFQDGLKILDIGANFGQNLLLFSSQSNDVTAFEPNPNCLDELRRVLYANHFHPKLISSAVGSVEGQITLKWPAGCTWFGTVSDTKHLQEMGYVDLEEHNAPVVVLDQEFSFRNKPILIKIDVEGFEADVLKGGKNLLLENDCLVLFEHDFSRSAGRREIWNFLSSLGYGVYGFRLDVESPLKGPYTLDEYLLDTIPNHAALKSKSGFEFLRKQ